MHDVVRNSAFTLTARYTEDSPVPDGFDPVIGTFEIGPPVHVPTDGSKAKIKVKVSCTSRPPEQSIAVAGCMHMTRSDSKKANIAINYFTALLSSKFQVTSTTGLCIMREIVFHVQFVLYQLRTMQHHAASVWRVCCCQPVIGMLQVSLRLCVLPGEVEPAWCGGCGVSAAG